jgi:hypothetical protein
MTIGATISHRSAAWNPVSKQNLPQSGIAPLSGIPGSGTRKRDKIFQKPRQTAGGLAKLPTSVFCEWMRFRGSRWSIAESGGVAHKAQDLKLRSTVALKFLPIQ